MCSNEQYDWDLVKRANAYLPVCLAKDANSKLALDEIEEHIQHLSRDFDRNDLELAMGRLDKQEQCLESIQDVSQFVTYLCMPFGDRRDCFRMMTMDLLLTFLSLLTSFVYLQDTLADTTEATDIGMDTKRLVYR